MNAKFYRFIYFFIQKIVDYIMNIKYNICVLYKDCVKIKTFIYTGFKICHEYF